MKFQFSVFFSILFGLFALIATIVGFHWYLNDQIEKKITSEKYMTDISKILRPYLIFDDKGIFSYPHGAEKYIEKITPQFDKKVIVVKTKEYLQFPPLIIFISPSQYSYNTKRIDNTTWSYELEDKNFVIMGEAIGGPPEHNKYLLEVLF